MKYNAGDKVRVIAGLETDLLIGGYVITPEMAALRGQVVTIDRIGYSSYGLAEMPRSDFDYEWWTDEMFDGLVIDAEPEKPEGPAFKAGDRVRVRKDLIARCFYNDELGREISCGCIEPMLSQAGKVVTIKRVRNKPSSIYYNIEEDCWNWVYGEFDGLAEEGSPEPAPEPHTDWNWEDLF